MEITIKGDAKEIAALVAALQERQKELVHPFGEVNLASCGLHHTQSG